MPTYTTHYNIPKPLVNDPTDEDLWGDELNDGMDIIDQAIYDAANSSGLGVPSGAIFDFAGATAPSGYLLCYGQAVSRTTYADLFAAIGTVYGSGDGSTTFNIPDARGRVSAGKDDMGGSAANRLTGLSGGVSGSTLGAVGGGQTHTLTTAQLASHTHTGTTASDGAHTHTANIYNSGSGEPSSPKYTSGLFDSGSNITTSSSGTHTHTFTTASSGSGDAHNNVQPTIIFNKIIKE